MAVSTMRRFGPYAAGFPLLWSFVAYKHAKVPPKTA